MTRYINRKTQKLAELALMLDTERMGELTEEERERIYKAFMRIDAVLPSAGAGELITSETINRYVKYNIQLWSDGIFTSYPFSQSGLESANGDASSGDAIIIPAGTIKITKPFSIAAGVSWVGVSRENTILSWTTATATMITLAAGSSIENMSLVMTTATASAYCISTTQGYIRNINITFTATASTDVINGTLAAGTDLQPSVSNVSVLITGCSGSIGLDGVDLTGPGAGEVSYVSGVTVVAPSYTASGSLQLVILSDGGGRTYATGIDVFGSRTGGGDTWGITITDVTLINSSAHATNDSGSGATIGIASLGDDVLHGCTSIVTATNQDGSFDNDISAVYYAGSDDISISNCYLSGTDDASSGTCQAIWDLTASGNIYAYNTTFVGTALDVNMTSQILYVYACQYDTTSGTVTPLHGDSAGSTAQYLTLATDTTLDNERVFTPGAGIAGTDGGAGSTYTIDVDISPQADIGTPDDADLLIIEDVTDGSIKKVDWTDVNGLASNSTITGNKVFEGTVIINETGGSTADLRAESNNEANMIFLDASADTLALGGTDGVVIADGGGTTFPAARIDTPDEITATSEGVAASIATVNTEVTTNGDSDLDNVTLANGTSGQVKRIYCVVEGNAADTWKITPATMCGGTQITFSGVGEGCELVYADNEGWVVVGNNGGTIS